MEISDFDDILISLGSGKWNLLYFVGVASCTFWLPAVIIAGAYVAPTIDFICDPGDLHLEVIEIEKCSYTTLDANGSETEHKCSSWLYNQTESSNSLTSEFNLVCDKKFLRPIYQTAYMVGNIIGSPINGLLSDRFGRRTIVTITAIFGICSVLTSFLFHKIIWIIILRFVTGLCFHSMLLSSFTLFMEVCEPKYRSTAGIMYTIPWAFGTIWWGCLGYLIREWRWLQGASLLPAFIMLICLCFYDESPRWLIVNGHHDRAFECIKKAARWNKSDKLLSDEELRISMTEIQKTALVTLSSNSSSNEEKSNFIVSGIKKILKLILLLFKTSELRRITLLMYFTFFVSGLVYYGFSLNASNFDLNPYMYMIVVGITQLPAYAFTGHVIARFGRVKPTAVTFIGCGISGLVLAFLPTEPKWLVLVFAIVGNSCIASAFQIVFLLATEVFPTEVRLQGFGTSSFLSSVGGGVAPFITDPLGSFHAWIPSVFFGALGTAAGISSIFIPETLNKHLPETIEELEENKRRRIS